MCGVEMSGSQSKHTEELCTAKPLKDDEAFEIVDGREIWHPVWKGNINNKINVLFIKNVIQHIWQNEKVSVCLSMCGQEVLTPSAFQRFRDAPGGKSEIADANFMMPVITS